MQELEEGGCRWDWGGTGPCAEIVLLLFPRRESDSPAAPASVAVPWLCPSGMGGV